jgi:hypothetical protein
VDSPFLAGESMRGDESRRTTPASCPEEQSTRMVAADHLTTTPSCMGGRGAGSLRFAAARWGEILVRGKAVSPVSHRRERRGMGKPGHGKPGLARKSRAWAALFGPMGWPRQRKHGPTAYSGRAWVANLDDFGKARPKSPMAQQEIAYSGWAWADIFRPNCQAGPGLGSHFLFWALSWPGPRRCPGIGMGNEMWTVG